MLLCNAPPCKIHPCSTLHPHANGPTAHCFLLSACAAEIGTPAANPRAAAVLAVAQLRPGFAGLPLGKPCVSPDSTSPPPAPRPRIPFRLAAKKALTVAVQTTNLRMKLGYMKSGEMYFKHLFSTDPVLGMSWALGLTGLAMPFFLKDNAHKQKLVSQQLERIQPNQVETGV